MALKRYCEPLLLGSVIRPQAEMTKANFQALIVNYARGAAIISEPMGFIPAARPVHRVIS